MCLGGWLDALLEALHEEVRCMISSERVVCTATAQRRAMDGGRTRLLLLSKSRAALPEPGLGLGSIMI